MGTGLKKDAIFEQMKAKTEKDNDYKGKLLRLFREIMLLSNTPAGYTAKELAEKVGSSWRTVYRDIQLLGEVGFLTEEIERGRFVIRGADREVRKFEKNLQFTPVEAGILSQAVSSISDNNPIKKTVLEKLLSFSGMEDVMKTLVKVDISRNYETIARAMREKRQVVLVNYASSHSGSIRNRNVEPFQFSKDGMFLKAFEPDSLSSKTFKMERIEEVIVTNDGWKHESRHEKETETDIFGFTGESEISIRLGLSLRAANLMKEEHPGSHAFITRESAKRYLFEGPVRSFTGVGRFCLGLLDEVEVLSPPKLKDFLEKKVKERSL